MKKLSLIFMLVSVTMINAFSQTTMTPATGSVDSSAVEYITATIGGGAGNLTIQPVITKVANTGTVVAGYCILQGSLNGTTFVNVKTWKTLPKGSYGTAEQAKNVWDVDTFTLADVTTAQTYCWLVTTECGDIHPYYQYRIAIVMTTTKVTGTGTYVLRKRI